MLFLLCSITAIYVFISSYLCSAAAYHHFGASHDRPHPHSSFHSFHADSDWQDSLVAASPASTNSASSELLVKESPEVLVAAVEAVLEDIQGAGMCGEDFQLSQCWASRIEAVEVAVEVAAETATDHLELVEAVAAAVVACHLDREESQERSLGVAEA